MPRSPRGRSAPATLGSRVQTYGLFALLLAVAVLVGSLAAGLMGDRGRRAGPPAADDSPRAGVERPAERVRVEVLNASGVPGLARRGTESLRDAGFDVVSYGNARGFAPDTSLVMDRVGRMELARSVADALEVPRVYARPDSNVYVDVTVILGRDWAAEQDTTRAEEIP